MSHRALAAARPSRHLHSSGHLPSSGRGLRDRIPSIIAATLLVIPVFIAAASLPRAAFGDPVPTLVFTNPQRTITAGLTSDVITVQRQDGGGTPTTTGDITVYLSAPSGTFRDASNAETVITYVDITEGSSSASFRYNGTHAPNVVLTAADQASGPDTGLTDGTQMVTIDPADLDHFTIDNTIAAQTAGVAFTVTATARDQYGNAVTGYLGGASIKQDLADSPGCASCSPALTAQAPDYGTFDGWVNGSSSVQVTAYNAQTGVAVTVKDGSIDSAASSTFDVANATALKGFTITTSLPATKTAGVAFTANVTPYDLYGNVNKTYVGSPTLSGLANSPGCSTCSPALTIAGPSYGSLSVSNGAGSGSVTAFKKQTGATLIVTDVGLSISNSTSFDVGPGTALGGFTIDATITSPQTAGVPITVNATAYDLYGNVKTDYAGGASITHSLATSPGCATCSPILSAQAPDYGTFNLWVNGQSSIDVTAYKAQSGVAVTVEHGPKHSAASSSFVVAPGTALGGFTIDNTIVSPRTAGVPFSVTATAYDLYGNIKTNYGGGAGVTGNLNASPGFPPIAGTPPSYGPLLTGTWTTGSKTVQVTAFNAETLRNVRVVHGLISSASSNSFTVQPAGPSSVLFNDAGYGSGFNGQPYDTKKDTAIYSNCVRTSSGTPPCDASTSTRVKVLVRDFWGNLVTNGTGVTIAATTRPTGSSLTGVTAATTTNGIAIFGAAGATNELVIAPTGTTGGVILTATAGSASGPSRTFQLVDDLEVCSGSACDNLAKSASYSIITPNTTGAASVADPLSGVTLTTQQLATNDAHCVGQTTPQVGKTGDVHVQGIGVSGARPKFVVVVMIPAATLQGAHVQSRNALAFNLCLGATWDGPTATPPAGSIWPQKQITRQVPPEARPQTAGSLTYWGWLPDCSHPAGTNPCIDLRTKNAGALQSYLKLGNADFVNLGFKSGDLGIIYLTQTPWDAKGSVF